MPELHKNQIEWNAPEPRKVSIDAVNISPVAESLNYLARVADTISQRDASIKDDNLKADLDLAEKRANKIVEEEASATADYSDLSERALSEIQAAFYKYDRATRVRFNRDNKNYMDSVQLAISDKIQKRRASQLENDVALNIPRWSTEALSRGKSGLQWMLDEKIAGTLTGLSSPEKIAELQFKARHYYDEATVNNGLNGDEDAVKATMNRLRNSKDLTSLNAYERSTSYARGKSIIDSYEKAKKSGDDPQLKLVEEMYATYAMVQDGNNMELLYDDIIGQGSGLILIGSTKDKDGNIVPQYINMNDYTPAQRLNFATKLSNAYDKHNVDFKVRQDLYSNDITKMMIDYKRGKDNKTGATDTALAALSRARQNVVQFSKLDEGTRKEVDALLENEKQARIEALNGSIWYKDTALWTGQRRENPMVSLIERIQKGAEPKRGFSTEEWWLGRGVDADQRGDGGLLQNAVQLYKNSFAKDMGRDTVSEYALITTIVLKAFKDAGKLESTRLAQSDGVYIESLVNTMDDLRQKGMYNANITDDNAKEIQSLFMRYTHGQPTEDEKKIINDIEKWAMTAQSVRSLDSVSRYITRPEPDTTNANMTMNGAYLQPAQDVLDVITKMGSKNKAIEKARKGE